jgi:preprotein translocase YajC subunit
MAVMWSVIFYTVLAVVAFYFILLQPVLKTQKAQRKAVQSLQIGDEVVTTGGLIAEVIDVVTPPDSPTEIILEIAPGVRVRALTDAIQKRLTTLEPAAAPGPSPEPTTGEVSHTRA